MSRSHTPPKVSCLTLAHDVTASALGTCAEDGAHTAASAPFHTARPDGPSLLPGPVQGGRALSVPETPHAARGLLRYLRLIGPIIGDILGALSLFILLFGGLFIGAILS